MVDGASMGGFLWRVHQRLVGVSSSVHAECRRCGRTMGEDRQHCPDCGAADVARYDL